MPVGVRIGITPGRSQFSIHKLYIFESYETADMHCLEFCDPQGIRPHSLDPFPFAQPYRNLILRNKSVLVNGIGRGYPQTYPASVTAQHKALAPHGDPLADRKGEHKFVTGDLNLNTARAVLHDQRIREGTVTVIGRHDTLHLPIFGHRSRITRISGFEVTHRYNGRSLARFPSSAGRRIGMELGLPDTTGTDQHEATT